MPEKRNVNQRQFLRRAAAVVGGAAGFPYFAPSAGLGKAGSVAPSERITLGCIGLGIRGTTHLRTFPGHREAQIVAVCDLYRSRREAAKKGIENHYAATTPYFVKIILTNPPICSTTCLEDV